MSAHHPSKKDLTPDQQVWIDYLVQRLKDLGLKPIEDESTKRACGQFLTDPRNQVLLYNSETHYIKTLPANTNLQEALQWVDGK